MKLCAPPSSATRTPSQCTYTVTVHVRDAAHLVWLLINSQRVDEDLEVAQKYPDRWDQCVVLRRWWPGVSIDLEFRMFVVDMTPVAITQYTSVVFSERLYHNHARLGRACRTFFEEQVRPRLEGSAFALTTFVVDFAIHPEALNGIEGRVKGGGAEGDGADLPVHLVKLIELNPFFESTGMGLFDFAKDAARLKPPVFEFRVLEAPLAELPKLDQAFVDILDGKPTPGVPLTDAVWEQLEAGMATSVSIN